MRENRYPHVFQPLTIRGVTLKNRLQYPPTVPLKCTPEGRVGEEMKEFVAWQADTGVAYVTIGDTPITHDDNSAWVCELNINSDDCIHGMHALVETARNHGAELSVELAYAGRGNRPNADGTPTAVVSAERPVSPELDNLRTMDRSDMDFFRDRYVDCAVRCQKAGFRIIMIHCAHNNFLAQWLSTDSNVRTDEYGGSPENRRRFPLEVLRAVREAVGPNMVIEIRVSATEDTPGGLEFEESLEFMKLAQEYVDIIHISRGNIFTVAGTYTSPTYFKGRRFNVPFAAEAKKHLHVPVCVVGNITTLEEAEEIIASGAADIVAMAKSHMADSELVKKSLEGRQDEIRPCTRCDLCGNANMFGTSMRCAINPRFGLTGKMEQAEVKKKVMVIGGGPGGMMAAQTLVARGHEVTLYEKKDKLGGLLNDATQLPFKGYMRGYLDWDIRTTMACGANVVLNTEVTEELVERENPDAIIVATGSNYLVPPIPGIGHEKVKAVRDVDGKRVEVGHTVVVCGAGLSGVECALALSDEGKDVTVIDMIPADDFCAMMPIFNRADLFDQLEKNNVKLVGGMRIKCFTDEGVVALDSEGNEVLFAADTCVNALGVTPENRLGLALMAKYGTDVYMIGDCCGKGRNYMDANQEGYHTAMRI